MTRSDLRSDRSRALLVALLASGLTLLATSPAAAKKKPAPPADDSTTDTSAAAAPAADDEKPAAQAQDVERPKPMLDTTQEAPKTDSLGHVHFSSPNGEGLGRVVVNAPAEQQVKVFLEGRFFGTAPVTIYSVPKGDYIVEAGYPSGKQVSRPVTVNENEETAVDLGGAQALKGDEGGSFSVGEMTPNRTKLMYGLLIGGGVALLFGTTFGILELKAESDYENTAAGNTAQQDSIRTRGQHDAILADIGFFTAGAAAIAAAICALPMIIKPSEKPAAAPASTAFLIAPVVGNGTAGGMMSLRF